MSDVTEIESAFRAGVRAGEDSAISEGRIKSPHPHASEFHHWWTRGFAHTARLLRAIAAEHDRDERLRERDAHRKALNTIADMLGIVHEDDKIVSAVRKLVVEKETR